MPTPQMSTNSAQNSEPGHENLDANANEVNSLNQEVDGLFVTFGAQSHKKRKTIEFWMVKIDSDGTIKQEKLSVREAMKWPDGRRIILKFNNEMQPIRDEVGLLSGVLGMLGADYKKFPM
ncbi:hypothetical protein AHAS_Ahas13G0338800 [Arachis hypogaea]